MAAAAAVSNGINQKFQPGFDPEQIALKYEKGKPVHSQFTGDQVMFTLCDGRKWFADLYVQQKIEQMRIQPGEIFCVQITEMRRGQQKLREVEITAAVPEELGRKPAASAPNAAGETSASHLTRCYRDAVDIVAAAVEYARSKNLTLAPNFEDVRCLAATMAISEQRRAAA